MMIRPLDLCLILLLSAGRVAAQSGNGGDVCYILDGILIVYGVVLTVLYCRLKMNSSHSFSEKQDGDIYQDLGRHDLDTYDTLHGMKKKPLP
ncbi:Fc receptor, IgE, high affinity I, gamma polypeptide like [Pimephales promelas]|uniref:Fc receptor, IgE, high affinity I, gamma polypeptide like n=1 Tax=Pimephales promelas TaxID=90988 RepID=UPI0019559E71|nr:Fc receptor, IgE, high affinity I, gamma polypeptide like [Pimephales promelas]KAG1932129.1 high affinity immunoglobulin epsilon receptor subunit gamma [Pimephales promelas]